ncbi:MAG: glutathione S-transferase family protein [Rhodospirillaceae bacterium]|nr:glutathione S-transferase family protein [Rhodospirillaceae bacterium]
MELVIGNKNYSSWSLRPWLAMRAAGLDFTETVIPLDHDDTRSRILAHSPAGRVPVLHDGDVVVWESLAICEYIAEQYPTLWPSEAKARAAARAVSAEMHAGFMEVRKAMPMNCRRAPAKIFTTPEIDADIARIFDIWRDCRSRYDAADGADGADGAFLFGNFSIADAMFAPVVSRLAVYDVDMDTECAAYRDAVLTHPAMKEWLDGAAAEDWVIGRLEL